MLRLWRIRGARVDGAVRGAPVALPADRAFTARRHRREAHHERRVLECPTVVAALRRHERTDQLARTVLPHAVALAVELERVVLERELASDALGARELLEAERACALRDLAAELEVLFVVDRAPVRA